MHIKLFHNIKLYSSTHLKLNFSPSHRYLKKSKIDCLRFVMCPLLAPVFQGFFFAVAINNTNEANRAGGMRL